MSPRQPAHQGMEEEHGRDQLLDELGPVVASCKMRQLVQQAGAPLGLRPISPIRRNQDARRPAAEGDRRRDRGMCPQCDVPREPECAPAFAQKAVRSHIEIQSPAAEFDEHDPAAGQTEQSNHDTRRPCQRDRQEHEPPDPEPGKRRAHSLDRRERPCWHGREFEGFLLRSGHRRALLLLLTFGRRSERGSTRLRRPYRPRNR
jgi:hypothetical protein